MNLDDLIKLIIVVLLFVVPVVGQLLAKIKQVQNQKPPLAGGAKPPARPIAADIADEIEEFMRKAAERRASKSQRPAQAKRSAPPPPSAKKAEPVAAKPVAVSSQSAAAATATAQVIQPEPQSIVPTTMPTPFTVGLIDMLTQPATLRQTIVLAEILRRPEERWQ